MNSENSTPRKPLRLWPGAAAGALLLVGYIAPVIVPEAAGLDMLVGMAAAVVIVVWWLFFSRAPWLERLAALVLIVAAVAATSRVIHMSIAGAGMGLLFPILAAQSMSLALVVWAVASRRLSDGPRRLSLVAIVLFACGLWMMLRTDGMLSGGVQWAWRWTPTAEERLLAQANSLDSLPPAPAAATDSPKPLDSARDRPLDFARDRPLDFARDRPLDSARDRPLDPATSSTPPAVPVAPTAPKTEPAAPVAAGTLADRPVTSGPGVTRADSPVTSKPGVTRADSPVTSKPGVTRAEGPVTSKPGVTRAEGPATSEPGFRRVEWEGFRGPERDSIVRGVQINTDWSASPPVEIWRRPIGPGWSSFAVAGDVIYTQEQRGEDEVVSAYSLKTGKPVWAHRDKARFWESNGGAGPRGTPTLSHGRVYTLGATGILNALDPLTGRVVWSRNAASDTGANMPFWGFTGSPLVVGDVVIVATSGALAGHDAATGHPRWIGTVRGGSYSSPHLFTIDGVVHVVLVSGTGATSVAPADGQVLWEHAWPGGAIVQPAQTGDGDILINSMGMTGGVGTRRLAISRGPLDAARDRPLDAARDRPLDAARDRPLDAARDRPLDAARDRSLDAARDRSLGGWTVTERWTSNGLKPYFNDFVVHKGYAYGFDGSILASIDLKDGKRKWKGGRYGEGQLVLLADQDVLLVLSEEGELALVSATPDKFTEIARVPAIEGKTWNHPVVVGDVLLVRNGEEMAAFRLPLAKR